MTKAINVNLVREYFESGCLCIQNKTLSLQPKDVPDELASAFYVVNCKCSRNTSDAPAIEMIERDAQLNAWRNALIGLCDSHDIQTPYEAVKNVTSRLNRLGATKITTL